MRSQAAMQQEMHEFMDYMQSPAAYAASGGEVQTAVAFNDNGWRVVMAVGEKAICFAPGWGRRFMRGCKETAAAKFAAMPAEERAKLKPDEILAIFDTVDGACKEAMALERAGATPADLEREAGHA